MPRTTSARRLLAAAALLVLTACRPAPPEPEPEPIEPLPARSNILLITVDTLRADHLSSYGYPRATSPNIDRLAAAGVRFDQASAQWPKTTPAFASMFTSTYSKDNGNVRKIGTPLSCRFEVLAEVLQHQGYATRAVIANGAVGSELNFDQGFDSFIETWKLQATGKIDDPNRAEAVERLAVVQLDQIGRKRPFFLWVHFIDPHWPYSSPAAWRNRFAGDRHFDPSLRIPVTKGRKSQEMWGIGEGQVEEGHDDLAFYQARYDAAIAYTDAQIGKLLDAMRTRGMLEKTLTVLSADHGESLGDHGYYFDHGRFGFQTCLRVPLIVNYPGVIAPGVDRSPAELIDLAPTLIEATGAPLGNGVWMQGQSLTPRLRGRSAPRARQAGPDAATHPGYAFSEAGTELNNHWQKIVRDQRFKLIYAQMLPDQRWLGGEGVQFILYDLVNDPLETKNVAAQFPQEVERLKRVLWQWEHAPRFDVMTKPSNEGCSEQRPMDPKTIEQLYSLGYLGRSGGSPGSAGSAGSAGR
ncbi:MAG: sulfatase-like hydrolase/transferase [Acidobacteriota bacterium]|nr:sulfatase-like hydrolase/transferase [Acidobacteriota bacterium]